MNLAVDGRLKVHNFYYKVYPYTVEYRVETVKKKLCFSPNGFQFLAKLVSVEKSSMSIEVPENYKFRYKAFNYKQEPTIKTNKIQRNITWSVSDFYAIVKECYSPGWKNMTPILLMAPSEFVIEDYQGNMTDWNELGLFRHHLNKGRDVLPESVKQKVQEL